MTSRRASVHSTCIEVRLSWFPVPHATPGLGRTTRIHGDAGSASIGFSGTVEGRKMTMAVGDPMSTFQQKGMHDV